jgi:hypothetical protein
MLEKGTKDIYRTRQLGTPIVPLAVIKCQFCYWLYYASHVIRVISCHYESLRVIKSHFISFDVISFHFISFHFMSYHVMKCHIMS